MRHRIVCCLLCVFALHGAALAAEYFVRVDGSDENGGLSREAAFATVQRGVDALEPGDTLTIAPGEYHENVRRDALGSDEAVTTIRAEIPGTVILRGDVPAPEFHRVDGYRFVYAADFDFDGRIPAVNELDTLTILPSKPNPAELEFSPGAFHYDRAQGKLYISTSDSRPASAHAYSVSLIPTHGFYLSNARRVVVEGLSVTGFNALELQHHRERSSGGVWGMFLANGKDCVIRDCRAWMNGWGIGLNSGASGSGDNVIERCAAWGNNSTFQSGDVGGLTGFGVRRDVIRDSVAFLNGAYGVNIYGTGTDGGGYGEWEVPGNEPENKSRLVNNLAWGNVSADIKIKTGVRYFHTVEHSVGLGTWSVRPENVSHSIIGQRRQQGYSADSIALNHEQDFDIGREFADPANHDYRLQATSRFRAAGPDGGDRGPFSYKPNIFFVKPGGDDSADGLSIEDAWRTLARGLRDLRPGDTLYLSPGAYEAGFDWTAPDADGDTVSIRGRGRGTVAVRGELNIQGGRGVAFERLAFSHRVTVEGGEDIRFANCSFTGERTGLAAVSANGLKIEHCLFTGFAESAVLLENCRDVDVRGALFDNRHGVAVTVDDAAIVAYSDYNSYARPEAAWETGAQRRTLADLRPRHDRHSAEGVPEFAAEADAPALVNPERFAAIGPYATRPGPHRFASREHAFRLTLDPVVHSVGATTANIEWMTSLPVGCLIAWGETPECENTLWFDVNYFGTYSLTGLEPGKTYYFKVAALRAPSTFRQVIGIHDEPETAIRLTGDPIEFTTLHTDPPAQVYHVAPDGDDANEGLSRGNAWRSIGHAASKVKAGDTVLVGEGEYEETVRVRATGAPNAPITFKNAPGERVVMAGAGESLTHGFIVGGKRHLRFDGFTFRDYNMFSGTPHAPFGWHLIRAAEFNLYRSGDVRISRCMSDGRGGYSATFLNAFLVDDLAVENSVFMNKMGGALSVSRCPNAQIRHNVFLRPMISSFQLNNVAGQDAVFHNNIFCGMLEKKANLNVSYAEIEDISTLKLKDNAFLLRCFPPEERIVFQAVDHAQRRVTASYTVPKFDAEIGDTGSVLADPEFVGVLRAMEAGERKPDYPPEMLLRPGRAIDFSSFFATHPDMVERGIGLQPEAFEEFGFRDPE